MRIRSRWHQAFTHVIWEHGSEKSRWLDGRECEKELGLLCCVLEARSLFDPFCYFPATPSSNSSVWGCCIRVGACYISNQTLPFFHKIITPPLSLPSPLFPPPLPLPLFLPLSQNVFCLFPCVDILMFTIMFLHSSSVKWTGRLCRLSSVVFEKSWLRRAIGDRPSIKNGWL